jgi:hypothetical protein
LMRLPPRRRIEVSSGKPLERILQNTGIGRSRMALMSAWIRTGIPRSS